MKITVSNGSHTVELEGADVRQLYHWMRDSLRRDDLKPARRIFVLVGEAYVEQAYLQGRTDADTFDEPRLTDSAHPLWRAGYERGWEQRKDEMAVEVATRLRTEVTP